MRHLLTAALTGLLAASAASAADGPIRLANHPALSPDGATLAFDWAGDLWAVPSAGGVARPLTAHPARDTRPVYSPDGARLAFVSDRTGSPQVFVMPAAGGTPKQVTAHTAGYDLLGWHPDGKRLLVSSRRDHGWSGRGSERFFLVTADEKKAEELVFDDYGHDTALSPDGKAVAFVREGPEWWRKGYKGSQGGQLWVFDQGAKGFKQLLAPPHGLATPVWKPDGSGLLVCTGTTHFNLHELDPASGELKPLTTFADDHVVQPCVSKDGSTIAFRHLFDLYVLKKGESQPRKLSVTRSDDRDDDRTDRRSLTRATDAAFTADGLEVALVAGDDLWVMDTELREPVAVTRTPEGEVDPVFAPDGNALYFVSDVGGKSDVYKATRSDDKRYWWQNKTFKVEKLTGDGEAKSRLTVSPDGKKLAFLRGRGDLVVCDADGKNPKAVVKSFSSVDYDWSPDGKWLTYAREDENFNRDVWVEPVDGSRPAVNLSRHPYNDGGPKWSPDGRVIAFTGQRENKEETDVHFVWLRAADGEKDGRDRTLEKALEKMNRGRSPAAAPPPRKAGDDKAEDEKPAEKGAAAFRKKAPPVEVVIDFDGIKDRVRRVTISDSSEGGLFWAPDGKRLAFQATVDAQRGTYFVDVTEEPRPNRLSAQTGTGARWLGNNTVVWLSGGVPASIQAPAARPAGGSAAAAAPSTQPNPAAPTTPAPPGRGRPGGAAPAAAAPAAGGDGVYRFTALQEVDLRKRNAAAFDLAWRIMRDNWYDEKLGNRDWAAVRAKYIDLAADAPGDDGLATVVRMMLGELNGSHLGFTPSAGGRRGGPGGPPNAPTDPPADPAARGWQPVTAHLGLRFVDGFAGPGLKVRDVLPNGPAERRTVGIKPGDIVTKIDGVAVSPADDLAAVLTGPLARDITLTVRPADGPEKTVTLRPISYAAARTLLYEAWIRHNRKQVEEQSNGTLGYLHVSAMSFPSFHKFIEALYDAGAGKKGLVIDVRENGGGSTADHLLTALTQPRHAIAVPRGGGPGYPQDRTVYATWDKPVVVLCNQNSFSNAEIFSHAVKTLGRGKLVGVPTA